MAFIPKCMSTQHPDNAFVPTYATDGVIKGDGEITEAVEVFNLGCDEQMWDSEGKETDNQVVQKLLSAHSDFFKSQHHLGKDSALTLRVPNPAIETEMRKSTVEALQGIPKAWDMASEFYGNDTEPPIQEVILPFTTSAQELALLDVYYQKFVVGQENQELLDSMVVKDWIGEFFPKRIRIIPLIEDLEHLTGSDLIVSDYLEDLSKRGVQVDYQRVFLARSDPALNYGAVSAEMMIKIALSKLSKLQERLGLPIYPIIGAGSVPFRGHLSPLNVNRAFREYPSAQTFTVQSAFKFDHPQTVVKSGIQQILSHERTEAPEIDELKAQGIIKKIAARYNQQVRDLIDVIGEVSTKIPKRRERKLHVGLFGYGRTLAGAEDVTLPRAIGFAASMYSIGAPPELLGLDVLNSEDLSFIRSVYPSFDEDMASSISFMNEDQVIELLGEETAKIAYELGNGVDRIHQGLTTAIWAGVKNKSSVNITDYIEEAAQLRRFLG